MPIEDDDEKRVAKILGAGEDEDLPNVSEETLKVYYGYLSKNLSFPFDAEYSRETGPLEDTYYDIEVTDILSYDDVPDLESYGLFCTGKQGRRKIEIPLAEIEVKEKGKNEQVIEDYSFWFCNYR